MKHYSEHITRVRVWAMLCLILLVTTPINIFAQSRNITGIVLDENNAPLIGVNVTIKGTSNGTVTNIDGEFNIEANPDNTLVISFIGYLTEEILIGQNTIFNLSLSPDLKALEEVVVVGYGTQRKSDVTGAVASIKSEDIEHMKANNIAEAMQGRAAGVTLTTNSGAPGSDMMINVRGIGTINNSGPLWVIDGVPSGGGYVNPSDIESFEILKDASAAAIYGSRGANGVIIITTKKGRQGKGSVTYDGSVRFNSLPKKLSLTNARDWGMLRNEAYNNAGQTPPNEIANWPALGEGTDWQQEVTRQALTHEHNLSFSGATDKLTYYLGVNHSDQEGIIQKSNYKRSTFRLNTSYKVKDWLTIGQNLAIANEKTNVVNEDDEWNAILIQAIAIDPITRVKNEDGSWGGSNYNTMNNPVAHLDRTNNEEDNFNVGGNFYLDFKLFEGLNFRSDLGIEKININNWNYEPTYFVKTGEENAQSAISRDFYQGNMATWSNYATYSKELNSHSFSVMTGTEYIIRHSEWFGTRATDLIDENDMRLITIDNAAGNISANSYGSYNDYRLFSLFGRANYAFKNRYLFTFNARRDGSSNFGPDKRYGNFFAYSFGWKLSDEPFMESVAFINNLKLRAGRGSIGNDAVPSSEFISSATAGQRYVFGNIITEGTAFMKIPNTEISWEDTYTTNVGVDAAFLNNRFTATIDLYSKKTEGMLVNPPIQAHIGAEETTYQNVGEMSNKGVEVELGYKMTANRFNMNVNAVFAYNKNEVVNLGNADFILSGEFMGLGQISRTQVGQPVASFYGFLTDGLFQNWEEINAHVTPEGNPIQPNVAPGDIRYKADENGNLIQGFIGSPLPDITYGLNINMNYRGFDFTFFLQGVQGIELFNATRFYTQNPSLRYNVDESMINRWMAEGTTNDPNTPRLNLADANNSKRSDRFVEDGAYLRVKTIQLGYSIPVKVFNGNVKKIRVYCGANNLYTLTNYTGFDPEVGYGYDGTLDIGIDRAKYPTPRTYLVGLNVTF